MTEHPRRNLVLAAMIFAVAMTFIDMTIVSIAAPELQKDLSLSSTGLQWVINGYLLALSALFAFGGRIADIAGHRRMVVIGVVVFAVSSGLCGATPTGSLSEAWIIFFRVLEGAGAALMFPAALAIVISAFPVHERGRAMAIFFAITGGLTSIGPLAGGYLSEVTWRAIFWVNIPVAIIALVLTAISKPSDDRAPAPIDYRGLVLVTGGMGLAILGLQQSSTWGWGSVATLATIAGGLLLLAAFVRFELRAESPLLDVRVFKDRGFAADNAVLFVMMICFIPLFFFGSLYSQLALGDAPSNAGLYLLIFFAGFAVASQLGGRVLDRLGAKPAVVPGAALAAVGFYLWATHLTDLSIGDQWPYIVLTGAGMGLMLAPANTDALNRVSPNRYGEATGITQTVRNFGSSLGMAVLGTILITQNTSHLEASLASLGIPKSEADQVADAMSQSSGSDSSAFSELSGREQQEVFTAAQHDFAEATEVVFIVMAGVMAACFLVALASMPRGRAPDLAEGPAD
jgi:EmrB/QacA subfamily drug resistance transporter